MKNLFFSDDMSAQEFLDLKDVTRRLLRKQPPPVSDLHPQEGQLNIRWASVEWKLWEKAKYAQGEVVYLGEALVPGGVRGFCTTYRRDGTAVRSLDPSLILHEWKWKTKLIPSMYCPQVCARRFGRIVSARPERIVDMTVEEERREGFPLADGTTFEGYWERLHGERLELTTWVWRYEWKSISAEEAVASEAA